MNNFESQLSAFGKQRYSQTNKNLRHIINPRQKNISLSWITTPVAVSIGILIGLGIQLHPDLKPQTINQLECKETKKVIILPEFCYTDFATTIELPKFEIVINQINNEL